MCDRIAFAANRVIGFEFFMSTSYIRSNDSAGKRESVMDIFYTAILWKPLITIAFFDFSLEC